MVPGITSPVYKFTFLASAMTEINEGISRIDRILGVQKISSSQLCIEPRRYDIEFKNVYFRYDRMKEDVLHNISFTARQNKITAIVGLSGSGKSTIANLIPRFWDIEKGHILIGGVDIKDIEIKKLFELVSFVFQNSFLFNDTIKENIRMGNKHVSEEDIVQAAKMAQCDEFIEMLPEKYDTVIGESGVTLSGGEIQRICIARAILKNAPILILDEATAFSDIENEFKIQQALSSLMREKTVIIIAHRLSSVISADKILVLDNGTLVQQGNHNELCSKDGCYKILWDLYTQSYDWKLKK